MKQSTVGFCSDRGTGSSARGHASPRGATGSPVMVDPLAASVFEDEEIGPIIGVPLIDFGLWPLSLHYLPRPSRAVSSSSRPPKDHRANQFIHPLVTVGSVIPPTMAARS